MISIAIIQARQMPNKRREEESDGDQAYIAGYYRPTYLHTLDGRDTSSRHFLMNCPDKQPNCTALGISSSNIKDISR